MSKPKSDKMIEPSKPADKPADITPTAIDFGIFEQISFDISPEPEPEIVHVEEPKPSEPQPEAPEDDETPTIGPKAKANAYDDDVSFDIIARHRQRRAKITFKI